MIEEKLPFRWVVLLLVVLVDMCVTGMVFSCMPSLYGEITKDIPMNYTQWGGIWGVGAIASMIFSLIGGMYVDRLGIRIIGSLSAVLTGIFCIGRAFAHDFYQLLAVMFLTGMSSSFLMPNMPKALGHWFTSDELGLANGIRIAGICVGSGSALMLSGVFLSPLVGGWRNLMWFYGLITIALGIIWILVIHEGSDYSNDAREAREKFSFREALFAVMRVRDQWFLMVARFSIMGPLIAVIGFLPEILVTKGMEQRMAHLSSSLIYYVNILGVLVVPMLSDKYGLRKIFIWPFSLIGALFVILLGMITGITCLIVCSLLGLIVGFIPLLMILPMEMEGIGHKYFGTSLGLSATFGSLGRFFIPIVGGKIIDLTGTGLAAFFFWGMLMLIGSLFILPMKEMGHRVKTISAIKEPME